MTYEPHVSATQTVQVMKDHLNAARHAAETALHRVADAETEVNLFKAQLNMKNARIIALEQKVRELEADLVRVNG